MADFDPDAYLSKRGGFDPDAYLATRQQGEVNIPQLAGQVVAPEPPPYDYSRDMPPDVEGYLRTPEAQANARGFQTALGETVGNMVTPENLKGMLSPSEGARREFLSRVDRALRGTVARARGADPEQAARTISPEYEMGRQMQEAETPEDYYRAAIPLGMEAAQFATLPFAMRVGAGVPRPGGPPPVPPPVQTGPLMAIPDPFAPTGAPSDLADAIRRAGQTRMDTALSEQAGRMAQPPLLTEQFAQPPETLTGPAPQYDPMAAARWHQQVQAELQPVLAQEYLLKKMGHPVPKPVSDAITAGNKKLQQGYQPPPETRFVIPAAAAEQPGVVYAKQIRQTAPSNGDVLNPQGASQGQVTGGQVPAPVSGRGIPPRGQGQVVPAGNVPGATQPGPPAPSPAGQPPFTGAHHAALTAEYGPQVIERGVVKDPVEYIAEARGRAGKVDPYQAASKVRSGQAITPEELADLVVEHDRLRDVATNAEKVLQTHTNPQTLTDWNEAMQAKQDFAQSVLKPAATRGFAEFGRVLQEVEPADPATVTGATEIAQKRLERELLPKEKKDLATNTKRTQDALAKEDARARKALSSVKPGKVPTREEMSSRMAKIVKDLTPCTP